jgi:ornithine cyclodeaminase/alanine dehydrogenase-like protein (mu-crystallin family)
VRCALADFSQGTGHAGVITFAPAGPDGDVHVKTAWLPGGRYFCVKVATWFTGRAQGRGEPADGYLAVHDARTGEPVAILRDEHYLTDLRTAAAGAATITALARDGARQLGVIGSGTQARLQAMAACEVAAIRGIRVWGRNPERAAGLCAALTRQQPEITVETVPTAAAAVAGADIVVTATTSREPVLSGSWLEPGQHVVAVGADDPGKAELDPECFSRAGVVAVDSRHQTPRLAGDLRAAIEAGAVELSGLTEIGDIIAGRARGRRSDDQVTVAKLIGLGVQDLAAAQVALRKLGIDGPPW